MKKTALQYILIACVMIIPLWVHATPTDNVTGWAWSDMPNGSDEIATPGNPAGGRGLGWIHLNGANYGVNLDKTTGQFDGYGWSEYGGWVDFSPAGPYPSAGPNYSARVDANCLSVATQSCPVTGWIRFIGAPADPQAGGWDGWVKMSGSGYGVTLGPADSTGIRHMSGKAWGDMVAGWIDFKWAQVAIPLNSDIPGCTDDTATNYNPLANINDGSCIYTPDLCPNIEGVQNPIPGGLHVDPVTGECVKDPTVCPTINYPGGIGYDPTCKCQGAPGNQCDNVTPDACPTTKFQIPSDPVRNGQPDPNTTPPGQITPPSGYSVHTVNNVQLCGIWGCTYQGYDNTNNSATIEDGSCHKTCAVGDSTYNSHFGWCSPCNDKSPGYNKDTGLCPKGPKNPVFHEE